ncbi:MAG: hypothetical protein ACRC6H_09555, partial [Culicoidibacterales bacterium]
VFLACIFLVQPILTLATTTTAETFDSIEAVENQEKAVLEATQIEVEQLATKLDETTLSISQTLTPTEAASGELLFKQTLAKYWQIKPETLVVTQAEKQVELASTQAPIVLADLQVASANQVFISEDLTNVQMSVANQPVVLSYEVSLKSPSSQASTRLFAFQTLTTVSETETLAEEDVASLAPTVSLAPATPEVETPEVTVPETEAETPEVSTPEATGPEVEVPEVVTPSVEMPEIALQATTEIERINTSDDVFSSTRVISQLDEANAYQVWMQVENITATTRYNVKTSVAYDPTRYFIKDVSTGATVDTTTGTITSTSTALTQGKKAAFYFTLVAKYDQQLDASLPIVKNNGTIAFTNATAVTPVQTRPFLPTITKITTISVGQHALVQQQSIVQDATNSKRYTVTLSATNMSPLE